MATKRTSFLAEVKDKKRQELTISFSALVDHKPQADEFIKDVLTGYGAVDSIEKLGWYLSESNNKTGVITYVSEQAGYSETVTFRITEKNGRFYCTSHNDRTGEEDTRVVDSTAEAKAHLEKKGYEVQKIVYARDHHICKYCNSIAEGSHEDLLCEDCRYTFGHSLYSEL